MTDWELLAAYGREGSGEAFGELVRRHIDWVYSAAARQTRDRHLAEDVTQGVFIALGRKGPSLGKGVVVSAWLFQATRYASAHAMRAESRRRHHEREAAAMKSECSDAMTEAEWEEVAPVLDEVVGRLGKKDREAVVLRFYQKKSLAEVGKEMGVSEEAAKKRVQRAVEKLRGMLGKRGLAVGSGGVLAAGLAVHATQAAPAGLVGASVAAAQGAAAGGPGVVIANAALRAMTWAKARLVAGICAALVVIGAAGAVVKLARGQQAAGILPATTPVWAGQGQTPPGVASELADRVAAAENAIVNLTVQGFDLTYERQSPGTSEWRRTNEHLAGNAWYDGRVGGKVRIDFSDKVLPWVQGPAPWSQESSDEGYDGRVYRYVIHRGGPLQKQGDVKRAVINSSTPMILRAPVSGHATGVLFTAHYTRRPRGGTISTFLREFASGGGSGLAVEPEVLDGCQTIRARVTVKVGTAEGSETWWFEPAKGYAIRKYERRSPDGRVWRDIVEELTEAAPGVWYPLRATHEEPGVEVPDKEESALMGSTVRVRYRATAVRANTPDFDESIFTVPVPSGYLVYDQARRLSYTAGN